MAHDAPRTVVFATMESEFSRYGGLGAVMSILPRGMLAHEHCVVLAPHFKNLTNLDAHQRRGNIQSHGLRMRFSCSIAGRPHHIEVTEVVQRVDHAAGPRELKTYLVAADNGSFMAPRSPYLNPCDPGREPDPHTNPINQEQLLEDALLFSAVAPTVLTELAKAQEIAPELVLHLQDWQTAAISCAMPRALLYPAIRAYRCALTLHNPYDRCISEYSSVVAREMALHLGLHHGNVLEQVLSAGPDGQARVSGPVSTVSETYARELREHPLFTRYFAGHLQRGLDERGLVGIDNGIFNPLALPDEALEQAAAGELAALLAEKTHQRRAMMEVLGSYRPEAAWGELCGLESFDGPLVLMFGRDDPRQKGYDAAARAVRELPVGAAKFVFTPMPGDEGLLGLEFLRQLTADRPGDVKVFPFRMEQGYDALQRGATFLFMPSFYEPFGGAVEGYAVGTPVIARRTGGLAQQVIPFPDDHATGFLYKESLDLQAEDAGWKTLQACDYWNHNPVQDRVEQRQSQCPLFEAMATSAAEALRRATDFYREDLAEGQPQYGQMMLNGARLMEAFGWERAVQKYRAELYR